MRIKYTIACFKFKKGNFRRIFSFYVYLTDNKLCMNRMFKCVYFGISVFLQYVYINNSHDQEKICRLRSLYRFSLPQ